MKFVSKNNNYRVVLKQGLPGERMTGTPATPGVYVKFEDGIAEVKDEKMIEMMLGHAGFGSDFVAPETEQDPFAATRKSSEPEHNVTEMDRGAPGKNVNPKPKFSFSPAQLKAIEEMTTKKALEMAPKLAEKILKNMTSPDPEQESDSVENARQEDTGDSVETTKTKDLDTATAKEDTNKKRETPEPKATTDKNKS